MKNEILFTGRWLDKSTNLYYYRARWYDAEDGRFVSKDPIGFDSGDWNLYRYVGNGVVNWIDAKGKSWDDVIPFWGTGKTIFGKVKGTDIKDYINFAVTKKQCCEMGFDIAEAKCQRNIKAKAWYYTGKLFKSYGIRVGIDAIIAGVSLSNGPTAIVITKLVSADGIIGGFASIGRVINIVLAANNAIRKYCNCCNPKF